MIEIRELVEGDWPAAAEIYREGLDVGTFEESAPPWDAWDARHLPAPRLVATDGEVLGWAAVSPISARECYRGVVHNSIYVARRRRGHGVGRSLLSELCRSADELGIWTIQAGIFAENEASIALHGKCGFRIVGTHERLAQKRGIWRDVVIMERRSPVV